MFTPISASGKFVMNLLEQTQKNLKKYAELREFILNLKKSESW